MNRRQSVRDVMKSQYLLNVFEEIASKEHSVENLEFLEAVGKYKKIKDDLQRHAKAKHIIEMFLLVGSRKELNINREIVLTVVHRAKDTPLSLFDEVEKEVEFVVNDTMMRCSKQLDDKSKEEEELTSLCVRVDDSYIDKKFEKRHSLDSRQDMRRKEAKEKSDLAKLEIAFKNEKYKDLESEFTKEKRKSGTLKISPLFLFGLSPLRDLSPKASPK